MAVVTAVAAEVDSAGVAVVEAVADAEDAVDAGAEIPKSGCP